MIYLKKRFSLNTLYTHERYFCIEGWGCGRVLDILDIMNPLSYKHHDFVFKRKNEIHLTFRNTFTFEGAVAALDVKLLEEDIAYLEEAYVPHKLVGLMANTSR